MIKIKVLLALIAFMSLWLLFAQKSGDSHQLDTFKACMQKFDDSLNSCQSGGHSAGSTDKCAAKANSDFGLCMSGGR